MDESWGALFLGAFVAGFTYVLRDSPKWGSESLSWLRRFIQNDLMAGEDVRRQTRRKAFGGAGFVHTSAEFGGTDLFRAPSGSSVEYRLYYTELRVAGAADLPSMKVASGLDLAFGAPAFALALSSEVRTQLEVSTSARVANGEVVVHLPADADVSVVQLWLTVLEHATTLIGENLGDRLARMAEQDGSSIVRCAAVWHLTETNLLCRLLESSDVAVRATAALRLGRDEVLTSLSLAELGALCRITPLADALVDTNHERRLLRVLELREVESVRVVTKAIARLSQVGTANAVEPLRERSKAWLPGESVQVLDQALAQIRDRLHGSPGTLSISDLPVEEGALSETGAGQVALAESKPLDQSARIKLDA